ncbi:MAG TPA: universal stress protein [Vicinamibacteria bacterium]|nr:universal stress protein [Vicinamibacteria bacterium]
MKLRKILLPTDFSENAEHALRQAVALALASKAKLHIFHAVLLQAADPRHLQTVLKDYAEHVDQEARKLLQAKSGDLAERGLDVEISTARSLSPLEAILAEVERVKPDLIVMGTHGRTGVGKLVLGSVAEKVVRYAPINVMTVRKDATIVGESDGVKRLLVPVDFTDFSRRALETASAMVSEKGSLTVVHVVASPIHPSFYAGGITRLFDVDPELPSRIRENLEKWLGDHPAEIVVTEGDIAAEILKTAEKTRAELIVMGTRGLTGIDHLLLGSVCERVVRTSQVPVLTVK